MLEGLEGLLAISSNYDGIKLAGQLDGEAGISRSDGYTQFVQELGYEHPWNTPRTLRNAYEDGWGIGIQKRNKLHAN